MFGEQDVMAHGKEYDFELPVAVFLALSREKC